MGGDTRGGGHGARDGMGRGTGKKRKEKRNGIRERRVWPGKKHLPSNVWLNHAMCKKQEK